MIEMINKEIEIKNIDKSEAIRYMGYKDTLPDVTMTKIILQCEQDLLKVIKPRYVYKVFDLVLPDEHTSEPVCLDGASLKLKGKSIKEHLKNCEKAMIMCATLSGDVDALLRKNEIGNMVNALVLDALANAAIEQVCDEAERIMMQEFEGYQHTWRFGVGYGDFPLSTQKSLLETLDAGKRIGVCATESFILTPRKSVTCVIGLSKENVNAQKSCDTCNLNETCDFRKTGMSCSM